LPDYVFPVQPAQELDRRALAKALTLIESTREDHREQAQALLTTALPHTGGSLRIGISGTPGVGKSTFIERFGLLLCDLGLQVAVLAVDPSSSRHGGSILGDKTRMPGLAVHQRAFIRPSPSGGTLGGVARRTQESILVCESFGFDVVLVETVGVGQSEIAVAQMTDVFVLLMAPAGGDELQGVKRGIMELADLLVVNKADGALLPIATATLADYASALRLIRPRSVHWTPKAMMISALMGIGISDVWDTLSEYRAIMTRSGELVQRREQQRAAWFEAELADRVLAVFGAKPDLAAQRATLTHAVAAGTITTGMAADQLIAAWSSQG
jgi:LAO/AO transport system kinase